MLPETVSGTAINTINGSKPNDLTYAMELVKNTVTITPNTTISSSGYYSGGWAGRMNWEYNRVRAQSNNKAYGTYLGIKTMPAVNTLKNNAYNFKMLHPNYSSTPF